MKNMKRKRELFPAWTMPSDPVKAVWWFLHWLLKVLVKFFWIPILVMIVYEIYLSDKVSGLTSGIIAGIVTLCVGLVVWAVLYGLLSLFNVSSTISQTISDVSRMQETLNNRRSFYNFPEKESDTTRIVEGTITDLDEERKKRRRE